jgi:hypothetical protein
VLHKFLQSVAGDSQMAGSLEEVKELLEAVQTAPASTFALTNASGKVLESSNPAQQCFPTPDQADWATAILLSMLSKKQLSFADLLAVSDVPTLEVGQYLSFCMVTTVIPTLFSFRMSETISLWQH